MSNDRLGSNFSKKGDATAKIFPVGFLGSVMFSCARFFFALSSLSLLLPLPAAAGNTAAVTGASLSVFQKKPLRLGIITLSETPDTMQAIDTTVEAIRRTFAPYSIEVEHRVPSRQLEDEIQSGRIDAFIASSGFFWRM